MENKTPSLEVFLEERRLRKKDNGHCSAEMRRQLEESALLKVVDATCALFNREAGEAVIEAHAYLPPEPVVRSFTFAKDGTEYVMRLDLWGTKPTLVFMTRKWRDNSPNGFVRWFWRILQAEPLRVEIVLTGEILEGTVLQEDVQEWFFYLLSGLSSRYLPSFKSLTKHSVREGVGVPETTRGTYP